MTAVSDHTVVIDGRTYTGDARAAFEAGEAWLAARDKAAAQPEVTTDDTKHTTGQQGGDASGAPEGGRAVQPGDECIGPRVGEGGTGPAMVQPAGPRVDAEDEAMKRDRLVAAGLEGLTKMRVFAAGIGIPFTQYLRPDGRKRPTSIERDPNVEELAFRFIERGGWFEVEELTTGHASLTACYVVDGEPQDIAIRVVNNGPGVGEAVDALVREAAAWQP